MQSEEEEPKKEKPKSKKKQHKRKQQKQESEVQSEEEDELGASPLKKIAQKIKAKKKEDCYYLSHGQGYS